MYQKFRHGGGLHFGGCAGVFSYLVGGFLVHIGGGYISGGVLVFAGGIFGTSWGFFLVYLGGFSDTFRGVFWYISGDFMVHVEGFMGQLGGGCSASRGGGLWCSSECFKCTCAFQNNAMSRKGHNHNSGAGSRTNGCLSPFFVSFGWCHYFKVVLLYCSFFTRFGNLLFLLQMEGRSWKRLWDP